MSKFLLGFAIAVVLAVVAGAQQVSMPPPAGTFAVLCAFNSGVQSITSGNVGFAQCDSEGRLIVGTSSSSPQGATTTVTAGTIAVTNTFQAALAASTTRKGCLLQNKGSNVMYVYFGVIGSATTPLGIELSNRSSITCGTYGNIVATDAVNVTGTAGDQFVVTNQ